jgi:hypothetical protein
MFIEHELNTLLKADNFGWSAPRLDFKELPDIFERKLLIEQAKATSLKDGYTTRNAHRDSLLQYTTIFTYDGKEGLCIIEYDHRQHNPPGLHHFGADVTAFVGQEGDIYFDVALGLLEHIYRQQVFRKY